MKTSTKLIIIFFTCIPMSLLAYNLILKSEYKKGNAARELYPRENSVYTNKTALGAFKHIVIDGSLSYENGASEQWMARVWIGGNSGTQKNSNSLSVIEGLKDNLKTTVKNDTLFIKFQLTGKYDNTATTWNRESDIVKVYTNQVQSVSIRYANITVGGNPGAADSLKLIMGESCHYDVKNLQLQKLTILAKNGSTVGIDHSNKIGTLSYSLQGYSLLNVDGSPAQHYIAQHIDGAARIQITGSANLLQKQLH